MHTVFHVSTPETLSYADAKVDNLIADTTVETDQVAVLVDSSVAIDAAATRLREVPKAILAADVSFLICSNAAQKATASVDDFPDGVEFVSSGVGELTRLQNQGYAYIKI
ncbi:DsrE family protein [Halobellus captivus]|uniref:DsrE family protein n=1 Tax=Halobellus captivus TaxID=2592614 RepID=UPI0013967FE7|nr:DsrE family protein [Halobellus captivus]